jgi:hypothetical protein
MITASLLLKTALEQKTAILAQAGLGGLVGALVGRARPESVKRKGHGAGRAALTGLATGAGIGTGALAGALSSEALSGQPVGQQGGKAALLALGLPLAGAAAGGLLGYHTSKDTEVDALLEKEKNKDH